MSTKKVRLLFNYSRCEFYTVGVGWHAHILSYDTLVDIQITDSKIKIILDIVIYFKEAILIF